MAPVYGRQETIILLRNSAVITLGIGLVSGLMTDIFFSLCMAFPGLFLSRVGEEDSPVKAGARGLLALLICWFIFWTVVAMGGMGNPYKVMLTTLDQAIVITYRMWVDSGELTAKALIALEQIVATLRQVIPLIMPGLLLSSLLLSVWGNLLLGNRLIGAVTGKKPWPPYLVWRLPERLVWLLIAGGIGIMMPPVMALALNIVIVTSTLYFFQGLAVFLHLIERWKVPLFARIFLYVFLLFQSYGLLMLVILGLVDVWADIRSLQGDTADNEED